MGFFLPIFSFQRHSTLDLGPGTAQTDRQTDRQTDDGHQRFMPLSMGTGRNNMKHRMVSYCLCLIVDVGPTSCFSKSPEFPLKILVSQSHGKQLTPVSQNKNYHSVAR